jgi:hypothetical protein
VSRAAADEPLESVDVTVGLLRLLAVLSPKHLDPWIDRYILGERGGSWQRDRVRQANLILAEHLGSPAALRRLM